jgi:hypothetical protein
MSGEKANIFQIIFNGAIQLSIMKKIPEVEEKPFMSSLLFTQNICPEACCIVRDEGGQSNASNLTTSLISS